MLSAIMARCSIVKRQRSTQTAEVLTQQHTTNTPGSSARLNVLRHSLFRSMATRKICKLFLHSCQSRYSTPPQNRHNWPGLRLTAHRALRTAVPLLLTGSHNNDSLMRHNLLGSRFCSSGACRYRAHPQCAAGRHSRQIQEKAQDYSGFGLKSQTPAPKSAQLSLAPARAAQLRRSLISAKHQLRNRHNWALSSIICRLGSVCYRPVTPQVPGHINAIGVDPPLVEGCCGELTRAV
jgi:hypothetical protein